MPDNPKSTNTSGSQLQKTRKQKPCGLNNAINQSLDKADLE